MSQLCLLMKLLVFEYGQFKHGLKGDNPQACLTKGSLAGCHTRWCGLESYLLVTSPLDQTTCHISKVTPYLIPGID